MASNHYWKIEGYKNANKIFERILPLGKLSKKAIIVLLQRLYAKHLDEDEIISSSLRRNARGYTTHLIPEISHGGHRFLITVGNGNSTFYTASVWENGELSHDNN